MKLCANLFVMWAKLGKIHTVSFSQNSAPFRFFIFFRTSFYFAMHFICGNTYLESIGDSFFFLCAACIVSGIIWLKLICVPLVFFFAFSFSLFTLSRAFWSYFHLLIKAMVYYMASIHMWCHIHNTKFENFKIPTNKKLQIHTHTQLKDRKWKSFALNYKHSWIQSRQQL